MVITNTIKKQIERIGFVETIDAMQGDVATRAVQVDLYFGSLRWQVPTGVSVAVAFEKPDGTNGLYDRLPDNTDAISVSNDRTSITAILAPEVLTVPGEVIATIILRENDFNQLASFPFVVNVEKNPAYGNSVSNNYYNYTTLQDVNDAVDAALAELEEAKQDFLTKAEEALAVVHDSATEDAPAIVCKGEGEIVSVSDAAYRPLVGLKLFGKTTQDGTPTPAAPVELVNIGASGAIKTIISTLFNPKSAQLGYELSSTNGATFINDDWYTSAYIPVVAGKIYFVGGRTAGSGNCFYDKNRTFISTIKLSEGTITAPTGAAYLRINGLISELYRTQVYSTENADQTLTASTPNGLRGIPLGATIPDVIKNSPVHMAGVWYCAEEAQYYFSSYRDWARGVDVHGVEKVVCDGTESIVQYNTSNIPYFRAYIGSLNKAIPKYALCDKLPHADIGSTTTANGVDILHSEASKASFVAFRWDMDNISSVDDAKLWLSENRPTVYYILATPTETALSAEELVAYAALHSNKPNTTVYNDAGAHMQVEYVADTENWFKNMAAALQAAILSQGANV